jgi:hypothetical protein
MVRPATFEQQKTHRLPSQAVGSEEDDQLQRNSAT